MKRLTVKGVSSRGLYSEAIYSEGKCTVRQLYVDETI